GRWMFDRLNRAAHARKRFESLAEFFTNTTRWGWSGAIKTTGRLRSRLRNRIVSVWGGGGGGGGGWRFACVAYVAAWNAHGSASRFDGARLAEGDCEIHDYSKDLFGDGAFIAALGQ